jgi:hypothetical protein
MSTTKGGSVNKIKDTIQLSPLVGTERALFDERKAALCQEYQLRTQGMVTLWEALSPKLAALKDQQFKEVHLITFFGTISLRCRAGFDEDGHWICPALARLGIRPYQRYSPDMERRTAVLAAATGSYEKAATVADTAAWFFISDGTVRSTVIRLDAAAAPLNDACAGAAGPEDTLIIMADGWNARHRGENWGVDKDNRTLPERIHWYEIRSAVVFKLSALLAVSGRRKAIMDKHTVAVAAETSPHDFGLLLHQEAVRMGLPKAKAVFFVMDGGVWLWNIFADRFQKCSKAMLDFYHLSQHLHDLGAALYGADSAKVAAWCGKLLHDIKHNSPKRLFKTLDQLLEEPPSHNPAVLEVIRAQNAYFRNHADHMDYAIHAKQGIPIGSGSVESLCSQFQNRLKRTGQSWSKQGFAALLRILVRHWNGELDSLWMASAA